MITIQPVKAPENIVPNLGYVWNLKGYSKLNSSVILNNIYSGKRSRDQGGTQVFTSCLGVRELKKVGNCLCSSVKKLKSVKSGLDGTKEVELVFAGFKKSKSLNNVFFVCIFLTIRIFRSFFKKMQTKKPFEVCLIHFFLFVLIFSVCWKSNKKCWIFLCFDLLQEDNNNKICALCLNFNWTQILLSIGIKYIWKTGQVKNRIKETQCKIENPWSIFGDSVIEGSLKHS